MLYIGRFKSGNRVSFEKEYRFFEWELFRGELEMLSAVDIVTDIIIKNINKKPEKYINKQIKL